MKFFAILSLFIELSLYAGTTQNTDLKTVAAGVNQTLITVNKTTSAPIAPCNSTLHISSDNCGSRVPSSYWKEFIYNLNQVKDLSLEEQAEAINKFVDDKSDLDSKSKSEIKSVFINMKKSESTLRSIDLYSAFLKDGDSKKLNSELERMGFSEDERTDFTKNFEKNSFGKNLKNLSQFGINYNSSTGGWSRFDGAKKGVITPKKIQDNSQLATSLKEVFGEQVFKQLSDVNRKESVGIGGIIFNPPNDKEHMATYSKKEWNEKVQQHLDLYYREIKEASEAIPKLGSTWDGWKLHSSKSHLKLVNDQYDRFNNATVQVEALGKMGFPMEETSKLYQQVNRMSTASADTVNDVYNEAESLRKKLYGVAAGAAFAATPYGQALFIDSLAGTLGYLAIAGATLPYIQNGVTTAVKVSLDGGSWWCQYSKTLASSVADSALNTITMSVIPIPQGGNTIRSLEALMKIGKSVYSYYKNGKKGWDIAGKSYDCYSASQAFKDIEEDVNFYSELNDHGALNEIKLAADEMYKSMVDTCTDLAFSGAKLGIASINSKIQKANDKAEEKRFKKVMDKKDGSPRVEQYKGSTATPTLKEGKSFYKATNGTTYEVKVSPNNDGTSKVYFLSGDRAGKAGNMSDENLGELFKQGRLAKILLPD